MASKGAYKRLSKEFLLITQNPPPFIVARPLEDNILEWHYIVRGPPDSPYAGGEYHGKLIFPDNYPYKPPAIKILTPNGRFQTDYRLCLTMSDYHPNTWNPAWSVATILTGLLSFMLEDTPTTGSIKTSIADRQLYAKKSHAYNLANPKFRAIFPDYCTEDMVPIPPIQPEPKNPFTTTTTSVPGSVVTASLSTSAVAAGAETSAAEMQLTQRKPTTTAVTGTRTGGSDEISGPAAAHRAEAQRAVGFLGGLWKSIRANAVYLFVFVLVSYLLALKVISRIQTAN